MLLKVANSDEIQVVTKSFILISASAPFFISLPSFFGFFSLSLTLSLTTRRRISLPIQPLIQLVVATVASAHSHRFQPQSTLRLPPPTYCSPPTPNCQQFASHSHLTTLHRFPLFLYLNTHTHTHTLSLSLSLSLKFWISFSFGSLLWNSDLYLDSFFVFHGFYSIGPTRPHQGC